MIAFIIFCIFYYWLAGMAIGFGLHRCLSHRAFTVPKWLERILMTLSLPAGTPIQWVGNHRYHHAHTDTEYDPHSPIHNGFWYAHTGWYLNSRNTSLSILYALSGPLRMTFDGFWRPRTNQEYIHLAPDVASDPYYKWLSQPLPYLLMLYLHLIILLTISYTLAGWTGVGVIWLQLIIMYNACDAIDSVAHLYGMSLPEQTNESRNNRLLAYFTLGEGWHANHHAHPRSARHGLEKDQFDWTWLMIKFFHRLGLVHNIYHASQIQTETIKMEVC